MDGPVGVDVNQHCGVIVKKCGVWSGGNGRGVGSGGG